MFQLLYSLVQTFLVPVCFLCAWLLVFLLFWSILSTIRHSVTRAKRMHQIPCTGCQFFTNDYRLKCTVNPHIANSEAAIYCSDYRAVIGYSMTSE